MYKLPKGRSASYILLISVLASNKADESYFQALAHAVPSHLLQTLAFAQGTALKPCKLTERIDQPIKVRTKAQLHGHRFQVLREEFLQH